MKQHDNTISTQCLGNINHQYHHDYDNSRVNYKCSAQSNSTHSIFRRLVLVASCDGDPGRGSGEPHETPISKLTNNERVLTSLAAGALAGAVAKTTIAPLDRAKIFFQTTPTNKYSARECIRYLYKTYKQTGFISLWRGNSATMARIIPYAATQFTAHEQYKVLLKVENKNSPEILRFVCGSLAGITAQSLTYPLDLCRARLAVSPVSTYTSLLDVFVKTVRNEGPLALYKGYVPTMLGVIPYAGCSFYCYEGLKRLWVREFGDGSVGGFERLCFGAVSGIIGQSSSYPLDIVRRRMQTTTEGGSAFRIVSMMGHIARTEGVVRGLYKGLSMNWIKGPVAAGISFAMFDWGNGVFREWVRGWKEGG